MSPVFNMKASSTDRSSPVNVIFVPAVKLVSSEISNPEIVVVVWLWESSVTVSPAVKLPVMSPAPGDSPTFTYMESREPE